MAQSPRRESSIKVTTVIGRRFISNGIPDSLAGAVGALREARPELVHEVLGNFWIGHGLPGRAEATNAEVEGAVAAIARHVPPEVLWHADLAPMTVCRVETDR